MQVYKKHYYFKLFADKCTLINCQNGGKCDIRNGKAVCVCNDKYTGATCETGEYNILLKIYAYNDSWMGHVGYNRIVPINCCLNCQK